MGPGDLRRNLGSPHLSEAASPETDGAVLVSAGGGCHCALWPQGVLDTGRKLSDDNTIGKEEIEQRLAQFVEHWKELKKLAAAR